MDEYVSREDHNSRLALLLAGLTVGYPSSDGSVASIVAGVDLTLRPGRILGLAGESGSGKSTTALSLMGFPVSAHAAQNGTSLLGSIDLLSTPQEKLRFLWGRVISLVPQASGQSLNPIRKVGFQLAEPLRMHLGLRNAELRSRCLELLESVRLSEPASALDKYPHQFSGGQQQRINLAIAMACQPDVLILDEPTSGLDVTTQKEINLVISSLVRDAGAASLYISHDLAMLATLCDEIAIMYAGEVVEQGPASGVYSKPRHPYTRALRDAVPRIEDARLPVGIPGLPPPAVVLDRCAFTERCRFVAESCHTIHPKLEALQEDGNHAVRCLRAAELGPLQPGRVSVERATMHGANTDALLRVVNLQCEYEVGRVVLGAVDDVSFSLASGEILAIVGESGSGKSTLLRAIAGLKPPNRGRIILRGKELEGRAVKRSRESRRQMQIVFQDPGASLNPRHSVAEIIQRPLALFRRDIPAGERRDAAAALLADVRLDLGILDRRPDELSGGQQQRVALAQAFAAGPSVLLCDEVVSALDVSVAASILELLVKLVVERSTALLFVTHNLGIVRGFTDRVGVMKAGSIIELGSTREILENPSSEYTRELRAAVPNPDTTDTDQDLH